MQKTIGQNKLCLFHVLLAKTQMLISEVQAEMDYSNFQYVRRIDWCKISVRNVNIFTNLLSQTGWDFYNSNYTSQSQIFKLWLRWAESHLG